MKPYSFEATFPGAELADLGKRLIARQVGLTELKDAFGCGGCVAEMFDGEELTEGTTDKDYSALSLEELGQELVDLTEAAGEAKALGSGVLLQLIFQVIQAVIAEILKRRIGGGSNGGTVPGPV